MNDNPDWRQLARLLETARRRIRPPLPSGVPVDPDLQAALARVALLERRLEGVDERRLQGETVLAKLGERLTRQERESAALAARLATMPTFARLGAGLGLLLALGWLVAALAI